MGATLLCWTDRRPATIIEVFAVGGATLIIVQEDVATRIDKNGLSECQEYEYSRDPRMTKYTFRREQTGSWQLVAFNEKSKRWNKVEGSGLRIGERDKYHDFSF